MQKRLQLKRQLRKLLLKLKGLLNKLPLRKLKMKLQRKPLLRLKLKLRPRKPQKRQKLSRKPKSKSKNIDKTASLSWISSPPR